MACLRNPQWEIYARELVEIELACVDENMAAQRGELRQQAYRKAGYAGNADNARRLASHRQVRARFRELFAEALEFRDVRAANVVTRIDRVGRVNLVDFYDPVRDVHGRPTGAMTLKPLHGLPRELTEAVRSIKVKDNGDLELELWDKNQANFTLLKHLGGLPDEDRASTTNLNILSVLSVADQRTLVEALRAIAARSDRADRGIGAEHRAGGADPGAL